MTRFLVIGENIHASRIVKREGRHVVTGADGGVALAFTGTDGAARELVVPETILRSKDGEKGRIKHVQAALVAGMGGGEEAEAGRAYLQAMAHRQIQSGAAYLDLNVDEISPEDAVRQSAMRWLVGAIEPVAGIPLALDSSSPAVLAAGLAACEGRAGAPLVNSASLERPEVLEMVGAARCAVVLSAAGEGLLPAGTDDRVENALRVVEMAVARGVVGNGMFIDPLVLPAAVKPEAAGDFLAAVRELRERLGTAVHITGGLSNVSFGLPARRVLNEVFIALAIEAGADSGIIDPVVNHPDHPSLEPGSLSWQLAEDLLRGRDPYGRAYLKAHRTGALGAG